MSKKSYVRKKTGLKEQLPRFFLLIALLVIVTVFRSVQPRFLMLNNVMNLLALSSIVGVLALGNMVLMSAGEMSFSIGAQCTLVGAVFGKFLADVNSNYVILGFLAGILASVAVGLVLALFTIKIGVPTFVCTLALATVLDGCTQLLNNGTTLYSKNWPDAFNLMQLKLGNVIPTAVLVFFGIALLMHILYEKTRFGRHLYAVGSNPTAANNSGISVPKMKVSAMVLSSVLCGFAGMIAASYNNSVSLTMGSELMLPAIAATMLSATFLQLGKYNVPGTVLAAILMIVIQNGVISAGYPIYVKDIIQGILLTLAVAIIALIKEDGLPSVKLDS
ncbi:ABC transporter permease [Faecalicatena sp. AGMB00832]|uniref:ABC transporter permease n=1 Tax=Faecalicatena faecalis TaxID=2726362 RepID=A0ABS6CZF6_9FIRM|nr:MULTISPECIES: ABC transporter permease [Faecalicatena]MBU3874712.1 ABC transporter permease [Faecalicatena faecalis]MCI6464881.1 ABC transporter permease [Faecalicatena sp.]MDY5619917.1 ABC transporter permease [Lachnospiraceae bacterium]